MTIERQIEGRLKSAFENDEALSGLVISGRWDVTPEGGNKAREEASTRAELAVSVPVRSYEGPSAQSLVFNCHAVLAVRADVDPTGAKFAEYAEAITDIFDSWQGAENMGPVIESLETDDFSPAFFGFTGGDAPSFDGSAWSVSFSFEIRGYHHLS